MFRMSVNLYVRVTITINFLRALSNAPPPPYDDDAPSEVRPGYSLAGRIPIWLVVTCGRITIRFACAYDSYDSGLDSPSQRAWPHDTAATASSHGEQWQTQHSTARHVTKPTKPNPQTISHRKPSSLEQNNAFELMQLDGHLSSSITKLMFI